MRRLMKFLHTMGAIGLTGALAAQLILLSFLPAPTSLEAYAQLRLAMGGIAEYLLLPSLAVVLLTGLWSMALTTAFHGAGWVWIKLATGILVFKGTLLSIQGPAEKEAALSARALAGELDPALLGQAMREEWGALWVVMGIAVLNVILGVWRPRLSRSHRRARARAKQTSAQAHQAASPVSELSRQ
jgi:hypothetical protein